MLKIVKKLKTDLEDENSILRQHPDYVDNEQRKLLLLMLSLVFAAVIAYMILDAARHAAPYRFVWARYVLLALCIVLIPICYFRKCKKAYLALSYISAAVILLCVMLLSMRYRILFLVPTLSVVIALMPVMLIDRLSRKIVFYLANIALHCAVRLIILPHATISYFLIQELFCYICGIFAAREIQNYKIRYTYMYTKAESEKKEDFLTGLSNRMGLFEFFEGCIDKDKWPIYSMYMVDVDDFKGFNDSYGHPAGDDCLARVGGALRKLGEQYNVRFFRYGGEEALGACLDPDADARAIASEICKAISDLQIPYANQAAGVVTVSVGYTTDNRRYERMVEKADMAMYAAKRAGKNRSACYEDVQSSLDAESPFGNTPPPNQRGPAVTQS